MWETKRITRSTLVESLRRIVPEFEINPDWLEDDLGYPIVNDLARYICDQARLPDLNRVKNGLAFLEAGLEFGDSYVHDLVHESLETLLSCDHILVIKAHFGPRVLDYWKTSFQSR